MSLGWALFFVWMGFLLLMGSFSSFGSTCSRCQDEINRGSAVLLVALLAIGGGTVWVVRRASTRTLPKQLVILLAGSLAGLIATALVVIYLMPA